jgi:hypothetical protein
MASTFSFAGTTLWSTAITGRGRPEISVQPDKELTSFRPLPGNGALVRVNLGTQYGGASVNLKFWLTAGGATTLKGTVEGLKNSTGQVSFVSNSSTETTVDNCAMVGSLLTRTENQPNASGTHYYEYILSLQFQRLG